MGLVKWPSYSSVAFPEHQGRHGSEKLSAALPSRREDCLPRGDFPQAGRADPGTLGLYTGTEGEKRRGFWVGFP